MYALFWISFILFVVVAVLLVTIILLQEPKQGGLGTGLDSGGMDFTSVRGTAGGLHRLTIYLGVVWGLLAIALAIIPRG